MLQWTLKHMHLLQSWFSLNICSGVQLLNHMVALFLVFVFKSICIIDFIYNPLFITQWKFKSLFNFPKEMQSLSMSCTYCPLLKLVSSLLFEQKDKEKKKGRYFSDIAAILFSFRIKSGNIINSTVVWENKPISAFKSPYIIDCHRKL